MAEQNNEKYGIRLTVPDMPPEKQLEVVNDFIEMITLMAKATGESTEDMDLSQAYATKEKLEAQIATKEEKN